VTGADNNEIEGIFKTDLSGRTISKHQIPLDVPTNGGSCHGLLWQGNKLGITAVRMNGMLRVDPENLRSGILYSRQLSPLARHCLGQWRDLDRGRQFERRQRKTGGLPGRSGER
jgi:hypothetical protein